MDSQISVDIEETPESRKVSFTIAPAVVVDVDPEFD